MAFSDGVVAAVFEPHKIPVDSTGVCYAMDQQGVIRRCRTSYVTDQQIRQPAARCPAPVQIPIAHAEQLEPVEPARPRPARTPRR